MSNDIPFSARGKLVIISGPSGAGKSCICTAMLDSVPRLKWSISATTRPMRAGEVDGREYHFLPREIFLQKIEDGEFIEYAEVHGFFYGTLARHIDETLNSGCSCLLDIDVQGAAKIKTQNRYSLVLVFIAPPDIEQLRQRLLDRGSDSKATIEQRVQNASREIEMSKFYRYRVINDTLDKTVETVRKILTAELP